MAAGSGKVAEKSVYRKTAGIDKYTVKVNRATARLTNSKPFKEEGCGCSLIICGVTLGVKLSRAARSAKKSPQALTRE